MTFRMRWRISRLVRLCLIGLVGFAIVHWLRYASDGSHPASPRWQRALQRRGQAADIDYAWGSLIHRFQNHPRPPPPRPSLPWTTKSLPKRPSAAIRCLLVTPELASLHKNGGIGTAFTELAFALGADDAFSVSVLMVQEEDSFPTQVVANAKALLASHGVDLLFLEKSGEIMPHMWTPVTSVRVWKWLRARDGDYDIIHFPDNTGIGYFSALGRHEGLALHQSLIVVGLHGPDVAWSSLLDKRLPSDRYSIELEHFERWTVELADVVVAPSEYILEYVRLRGWSVPRHSFVIPNIFNSGSVNQQRASKMKRVHPVTELVFFGRLEERKGPRLLIRALEMLYTKNDTSTWPPFERVTYLGRDHTDTSTHSDVSSLITQAIDELRSQTGATFDLNIIRDADRDTAIKYLQEPSRLALTPALADNSPNTVLECIFHSIRFMTSDSGGSAELIHVDDVQRATFRPLPADLAAKIAFVTRTLEDQPWEPVRPHPMVLNAAREWRNLHLWMNTLRANKKPTLASARALVTLCITHYERPQLLPQLLSSIHQQTYSNIEVVLVDDGSKKSETVQSLDFIEDRYFAGESRWTFIRSNNSYLGEARNKAAAAAKGDWLFFLDDDDVLKPNAVETLINVATRTGVDALSSWLDEFSSDVNPLEHEGDLPHRRTFWFLGQSLSAGVVSNCFGSGNIFIHRKAFHSIEGFSTYRDVGAEDWEIYMRLASAGWRQLVVPEELIYVRSDMTRDSMKFSMDPWDSSYRALVPLLNDHRVQSLGLAPAIMLARTAVDRQEASRVLADSVEDYQLIQGWAGWSYHFERVEVGPRLNQERQAVVYDEAWFYDRDSSSGVITADTQTPHMNSHGDRFAAVRVYTAPRAMTVAAEFSYSMSHTCGDGVRVALMYRELPVSEWITLGNWTTEQKWTTETRHELDLRKGSQILVWVDPLQTVDCDSLTTRLTLISVPAVTKAWSTLKPTKSELAPPPRYPGQEDQDDEEEESIDGSNAVNEEASSSDLTPYDYHLALIFDESRMPHAMSVIRSAVHFIKSRKVVFHLVTPVSTHKTLLKTFESLSAKVVLYDHGLCRDLVRPVLAFSNPDIHVSAHCKMFLSSIITDPSVESVMYLDSDVTILSDIAECYDEPTVADVIISMAPDLGDACQLNPDLCWPIGMHWRLPQGLKCGTVPEKAQRLDDLETCTLPGDLETFQVNGGVALFQLGRMRETKFVERYIQTIVHHYGVVGKVATWGEQDFINSFFRLFPRELELLPCGCNYQWFGSRREAICGEQPVHIAHHWSFGIATRTDNPFNGAFFHFFDHENAQAEVPRFPTVSPSLAGAPNTSTLDIERTLNCPRQAHACTDSFKPNRAYGQPVSLVTRFKSTQFANDFVRSIEAQSYPKIRHFVAAPSALTLRQGNVSRDEIDLEGDVVGDYATLCEKCASVREHGTACTKPPADMLARRQFFDCLCDTPDSTTPSVKLLEALVSDSSDSWVMHMDDDRLFVDDHSVSRLMAHVYSDRELIVFRSNTSTREADIVHRKKMFEQNELEGLGFLFHSSVLDATHWSRQRCDIWRTFNNLAQLLRIRWIDLVPMIEHPLQRHLPGTTSANFKVTVVVLETPDRPTWAPRLVAALKDSSFENLVGDVLVASTRPSLSEHDEVPSILLDQDSGLTGIAQHVKTEGVLLISDSIVLERAALNALVTFWLDDPVRIVGMFTESVKGAFSPPLNRDTATFFYEEELDPVVGIDRYPYLLPRTMLLHRSHLANLKSVVERSRHKTGTRVPPRCQPLLLSALVSQEAGGGLAPLRLLPPPESVIDRVDDCRAVNYPDVDLPPAVPAHDQVGEGKQLLDLGDCVAAVDIVLGGKGSRLLEKVSWITFGNQVGVAGTHGIKLGIERASEIREEQWKSIRKIDKCYRQ
ncbi:hypothetical protein OIV83_002805 [Microbotryomycetes sp. JL201]|nr:hypothetical protein OIV83_002805 [Microbotryomycetes sp. JL201]